MIIFITEIQKNILIESYMILRRYIIMIKVKIMLKNILWKAQLFLDEILYFLFL